MIRGHFGYSYTWPMPRIWVAVSLPGISEDWTPVEFLIDTGATSTILNPADAFNMRISRERLGDLTRWPQHQTAAGVGGSVINYVHPARYLFLREDDTAFSSSQNILIARLTADNENLPSLLGWDILRHFRLCTDVRTGEVLLEE